MNRNFPTCSGESVNVTLTVADGAGATDVLGLWVTLPMKLTELREARAALRVAFTSLLDVRPLNGAFRGMLVMNGASTAPVSNVAPVRLEHDGHHGKNVIGATLVSEVGRQVLWMFDFSDTEHFVSGSIRPLQGVVLTLNERRVVFRLSGASNEHVRFEYRLSP